MSDQDFKVLDDVVKGIVKEKQPFERLEMKKADLLEMFKYNQFKVSLILHFFLLVIIYCKKKSSLVRFVAFS